MLNAKKEVHGVSHSHTHGGAIGLHSINLFISIPTKVIEPSEDLVGGLRQLIKSPLASLRRKRTLPTRPLSSEPGSLPRKRRSTPKRRRQRRRSRCCCTPRCLIACEGGTRCQPRDQKCLEFGWKPAFDGDKLKSIKSHDIIIEQAAVLYNLAAAWSVRASEPPLVDGDAIKAAAKYFQLSAGALMAAQQLQPETVLDDACPSS